MTKRHPAIRVEELGKLYRIGGPVERYKTFRDTVAQSVAGLGGRVKSWFGGKNGAAARYETIWALKDVSFEVQPGEVVGIIGRNGAGKSTLLKILSRITEPTTGRVEIRGRVGSLLEVGTGFHPELTGRENVYLNGAILGMKRAEVDKKFDEIVAFAEIEKFIDTPVKHYSSGMYVRLAFSVAAHLDTDILLVDEVLSVGDVKFQQKCMGRMQDRTFQNKTILFVSHNLAAIANFCSRAILLEEGHLVRDDSPEPVLSMYVREGHACSAADLRQHPRKSRGSSPWRFMERVSLMRGDQESSVFATGGPWALRVECRFPETMKGRRVNFGFDIRDSLDRILMGTNTEQFGILKYVEENREILEADLKRLPLCPGRYKVALFLNDGQEDREIIENAIQFDVLWERDGEAVRPPHVGMIYEAVEWRV